MIVPDLVPDLARRPAQRPRMALRADRLGGRRRCRGRRSSGPHQMYIGWPVLSIRRTTVRSDCGQRAGGPSDERRPVVRAHQRAHLAAAVQEIERAPSRRHGGIRRPHAILPDVSATALPGILFGSRTAIPPAATLTAGGRCAPAVLLFHRDVEGAPELACPDPGLGGAARAAGLDASTRCRTACRAARRIPAKATSASRRRPRSATPASRSPSWARRCRRAFTGSRSTRRRRRTSTRRDRRDRARGERLRRARPSRRADLSPRPRPGP